MPAATPDSSAAARAQPGPGARVWLLRHPEVAPEWRGRAYGSLDAPLDAEGLASADAIAARFAALRPARVLSSPLARARLLAERLCAQSGCALALDARLCELDRGRWQGRERAELERSAPEELAAYYADPWNYRGHGGETDADLVRRAWPVLLEQLCLPADGPLVLVTHYNIARCCTAHALGLEPARSFALRLDPGRAICLSSGAHGLALVHSNVDDPLAADPERVRAEAGA